ncbi:MAG: sugar kinase, partial [Chloroflexota bacterium]
MMLIAGTVPIKELPLIEGKVSAAGEYLVVNSHRIPCTQGTAAMINAAFVTTQYLQLEAPRALIAGDIGQGKGSQEMFEHLIRNMAKLGPQVLALHYCLPDMSLMKRLCESVHQCTERPIMIADAGSMYAAKAAGLASDFDIFT